MSDNTVTQKIDLDALHDEGNEITPFRTFMNSSGNGIAAAGDTNPGLVRKINEDSLVIRVRQDGLFSMFAVADGICGQMHGDIASEMCVRLLSEKWDHTFASADRTMEEEPLVKMLREWIEDTNTSLRQESEKRSYESMMGTTIVILLVLENKIIIAHAGDSRIYRLRDGELLPLTKDHTLVEELISMNMLLPSEAARHPFAHVISRSVGVAAAVNPDISVLERKKGDRYLLCTDGITLHIPDEDLRKVMMDAADPGKCIDDMMKLAFCRGAGDNLTCICVDA